MRLQSVEEAEGTDFMCTCCVLSARPDRVDHANTNLALRMDDLEIQLQVERAEKRKLQEQNVAVRREGESSLVLIAGESNMRRCERAIMERLEGDKLVAIGVFSGRTMDALGNGSGGLNDVLNGDAAQVVEGLAEGIVDTWTIAQQAQIVVCAVPEVQGRNGEVAKDVVKVDREISKLSLEKDFKMADINREVHIASFGKGFTREAIHFSGKVGAWIGWRPAGRAVAYLGSAQRLKA
ncbi:uncharacterized protein LOC144133903 [Amblyomma americanum]